MKKINFLLESIINKKFSIELSGYNANEVDKFLDLIVEDYKTYKKQNEILEEKINEKNNIIDIRNDEIKKFKLEIENLRIQVKEASKSTNYEILKMIEELKKDIKLLKKDLNNKK